MEDRDVIPKPEFLPDAFHQRHDACRFRAERFGNRLDPHPPPPQAKDRSLLVGQSSPGRLGATALFNLQLVDNFPAYLIVQVDLSGRDPADGGKQLCPVTFHYITGGAGAKGLRGVKGRAVHGKHEDGDGRGAFTEFLDEIETIALRQGEIGHHEVRLRLVENLKCGGDRVHFSTNLQIRRPVHSFGNALPHERMVVHQQNTPAGWRGGVHGTRATAQRGVAREGDMVQALISMALGAAVASFGT